VSPVPLAPTESSVEAPELIVTLPGCCEIEGLTQVLLTVTVAARLSAGGAHWPVTRTQYEVVAVGLTFTDEFVAPPIGLDVLPAVPVYH